MKLKTVLLCFLIMLVSCQSSQKKANLNNTASQKKSLKLECQTEQQAKETLYSIKGAIESYPEVANCYWMIGKHELAKLYYQKAIELDQNIVESLNSIALVSDLTNYPLVAKKHFDTLINQIARYNKISPLVYFDYGLFSLKYLNLSQARLAQRKINKSLPEQAKILQSYSLLVNNQAQMANQIWKTVQWSQVKINETRAYYLSYLSYLFKDKNMMTKLISKFNTKLPLKKRIYIQKLLGDLK